MGHRDDKRPDERVVDYIYGELEPADAARFEAEMEQSPALAREVRELQTVARLAADISESEKIPEPPEAAVAAAVAAARARCDQARGAEEGFWQRVAAWLLTPQLAGALTLVLILGVGIYTIRETGFLRQDEADEPSVKHEMAPAGKAADHRATRAPEPGPEPATVEPATEVSPIEVPAVTVPRGEPVTGKTDSARESAARIPQPVREPEEDSPKLEERRWEAEEPAARRAAQDFEADADAVLDSLQGAGVKEVRAELSDVAGNFALKTEKKPAEPVVSKAAGRTKDRSREKERTRDAKKAKKTATTKKKAAPAIAQKRPGKAAAEDDKKGPAAKLEGLDISMDSGLRRARSKSKIETSAAPKISRSLLDGIVVPPSPEREEKKQEDESSFGVGAGGAAPSAGRFDESGQGQDGDVPDDAEPGYLTRPEPAAAPGIVVKEASTAVDMEVTGEEVPAVAEQQDDAALCAALASAVEKAEEDEDWVLVEKLKQQMIARGCAAGTEVEAAEKQGARYRGKAAAADLAAPAEEEAPAADKAEEPVKAGEPTQIKK